MAMTTLTAAAGLAGHTAQHTHAVWLVASGLGAVLLATLAVVYRRARARRELEEVDRVLADADAEE